MPKATNGTKQKRTRAIYELLLSDTPRSDILHYGSSNWGVTPRQVCKYIAWANEIISEEAERLQHKAFEQHLIKRATLRHKALKAGDSRLAFEILKDESKLLGLYPAKESKATNLDIDLAQLTDEQLQRIAAGEDAVSVMADK